MAYNYVVTSQKPTSVTHALTASFTGPDDLNLVLVRSTRLEVHLMAPEGLVPVRLRLFTLWGMCLCVVCWVCGGGCVCV